ncbi:MAG: DNA primase, partial [Sphingopyxis sp.]
EQAVTLRDVTDASAQWFADRLADDEGAAARAYLVKRGLSTATIAAFAMGYAPDGRTRLRDALNKFGDALAVEAGMLIAVEDKAPYDRFRGRLMIPIRDVRGRVIAFGGRILGAGEPKYLKSPDTPLFDKGRILYNLDRAAPAARATSRLIIVEGYMDVIALAQAGIGEAVAPLGTALTEQQIDLAWRQVPVPLLAFDGDSAGQRAALRAATRALPMLRPGHSLAFITMPAGQDPDDIVRGGGAAAFDALASTPTPLVDLSWQTALKERADDTPESRAAVRARLFEWADAVADKDVAAHYRQAFRERLDDAFFAQRQRPERPRGPMRGAAGGGGGNRSGSSWRGYAPPERAPSPQLRRVGQAVDARLADAVIAGLLRHPDMLERHAEALSALPTPEKSSADLLGAMIDATFVQQGLDSQGLMTILGTQSVYNKATELLRADGMHFSFTRPSRKADEADPADGPAIDAAARRDLEEAIAALVAWPEVEAALAAATDAARTRLDEESFAEQQRLIRVKADLADRLALLADTGRG